MKKIRNVLPLALVVGLVGCAKQKQALDFNQALVAANKKLENAGKKFGETIGKALASGKAPSPEVGQEYDRLVKTLKEVKAEMATRQTPNLKGASELRAAQNKFFQFEEQMLTTDFKEIADIFKKNQITAADRQRIQQLVNEVGKKEQPELVALQKAQREFASANGLRLQ
jgi:hypothetical protein